MLNCTFSTFHHSFPEHSIIHFLFPHSIIHFHAWIQLGLPHPKMHLTVKPLPKRTVKSFLAGTSEAENEPPVCSNLSICNNIFAIYQGTGETLSLTNHILFFVFSNQLSLSSFLTWAYLGAYLQYHYLSVDY